MFRVYINLKSNRSMIAMPAYTDLNDTNVDGVASSSFQGEFFGTASSMPPASSELEGRLILYTGSSGAYLQYAIYRCQMNTDGTWGWHRVNLQPPYSLDPLKATASDAAGGLVSSDVTSGELDSLKGITGNVQDQLDTKENTVMGAAMTITKSKLVPSRALISDANGNVSQSQVTSAELFALHGLTSPIQTQLDGKVDKTTTINGYVLSSDITLSAEDVGAMPSDTHIPSRTSELVNDSGYITSDIDSLENYYTKGETYTRAEVNDLVKMVPDQQYKAVDSLPSTGEPGYIYLIPSKTGGYCEQYVWSTDGWVYMGTTEVKPDIAQTAEGISINGTALQTAAETQTGLMTSTQAMELREAHDGFWIGGNGYVDSAGLHLSFETAGNSTISLPAIALGQGPSKIRVVVDRDHTWAELTSFSDGTYTVPKGFDVEVFSPGRFGETNCMASVIHIHSGAYVCDGYQDFVFSNAESNSRVGVRVLFQHDGTIRVYDANGLEVTTYSNADLASSSMSMYRLATQDFVSE